MAQILVVDDEPAVRDILNLMLSRAGHTVTAVANGREGLATYAEDPADVVFCDVFMPEMDGVEFITNLRRQNPGAKVIAMSGGAAQKLPDMLPVVRGLGATTTLQKPFTRDEVLAVLASVLDE